MDKNEIKISLNGQEATFENVSLNIGLKVEDENNEKHFHFDKTYEGTMENVKLGDEFLRYIEKQKKLEKIFKAREKLYKDMR